MRVFGEYFFAVLALISPYALPACAQHGPASTGWIAQPENFPGRIQAFEKNRGQFPGWLNGTRVVYGCYADGATILFTEKGIACFLAPPASPEDPEKMERDGRRSKPVCLDTLFIEWKNSNPHPKIEAVNETPFYFCGKEGCFPGYRKLAYHDIYPGTDLEFTFHPDRGIKYAVTVRPGYDASSFVMHYRGQRGLFIDSAGILHIQTRAGDVLDHAPVTRVAEHEVACAFKQKGDEVGFTIQGKEDSGIIIDPWLVTPTSGGFYPTNIGMDAADNTYVEGALSNAGAIVMYVQKYNNAGALQWTYRLKEYTSSPSDPAEIDSAQVNPEYQTDLAVDPAGNCYVPSPLIFANANGKQYAMVSIASSGKRNYLNYNSAASLYEMWNINYSCANATLIEGGSPTYEQTQAAVITASNGNIGTQYTGTTTGEIYAGRIGPDGRYYCLAGNAGSTQGSLLCCSVSSGNVSLAWSLNLTYPWQDADRKSPYSVSSNGIGVGCKYLYTSDGSILEQRDLSGVLIKSITLPGGINYNSNSGINNNSGIAVDPQCGYVYAGSLNAVYVYDENLNFIKSHSLPGLVYDVAYHNGVISACGTDPSSGKGFVTQMAAEKCAVTVSVRHTNTTCGKSNGTASVNASFCTAPYSYLWSPSGQTTQTATGLSAGTYTVSVSTQNSCMMVSDTVTVKALPGGLSPLVQSHAACGGKNGSAYVNPNGGTAPFTYLWSPAGGSSSAATGLSAGTYTVSITDAGGCSGTATVLITAAPLPSAVISSNATICAGHGVTLTASGGDSYSWSTGATTTTLAVTPGSTTVYTVTATNASGCTATATATVTVAPLVIPSISGGTTICAGDTVVLVASGGGTYSWNNNGSSSPSISVNPPSTTAYTVTVINASGCTATATATVTVASPPVAVITGNNTICAGDPATLTASGGAFYLWSNNQTTAAITINPSSTSGYSVVVSTGSCSDTAYTTIIVMPKPTPAITGNTQLCKGETATLTATGGGTYLWNPGGSSSPSVTVTPSAAGNTVYTVTITNSSGCSASATSTVTALPQPVPSSLSYSICSGSSILLAASGGGTYSWSTGDTSSSISVSPLVFSSYSVLVAIGSCTAVSTYSVGVVATPTATAQGDTTINIGNSTPLMAAGGSSYSWAPPFGLSCINCQNPIASPDATIEYCVFVTNGICTDSACVRVAVEYDCHPVYVPNAFSPNGDGDNDVLYVYGNCIRDMRFMIYNRWGEKVFESTNPREGWDGTYRGNPENPAVFAYYLGYTLYTGSQGTKKGNVSLVR